MPRPSSAANASERAATNVKRIVGANIKAHRIALGLSQEELAELFGISRAALSQIEIGVGEVNAGDLPRLASLLSISSLRFFEQPLENYFHSLEQARQQNWDTANRQLPQYALSGESIVPPFQKGNPAAPIGETPKHEGPGSLSDELGQQNADTDKQARTLGELLALIAELPDEDQRVVRRLVLALHGAQHSSAAKGSTGMSGRTARRVSRNRAFKRRLPP